MNMMTQFCACVLSFFSCVQLCVTLWTVACQVPLSMGFFRQEYWSWLLFSPPGDLSNPGIKPASPASPALTGGFFTTEPPGKPIDIDSHSNYTPSSYDSYPGYQQIRETLR